jgi:translation initiation factor 2 alpha subunit (eIF-2alpha)
VRTCEMTGDEATETVEVPPLEVTTTVEVTDCSVDGVETNAEAATGTEKVAPDGVVMDSVTYGDETPGV